MNFKYYDVLSTLISGVVLLFAISIVIDWNITSINVAILLSLAYVMGYMLNALSALLEPIYYWFMGGRPSDRLLRAPKPSSRGNTQNFTGFGRICFYEYEKAVRLLKEELNDANANEGKMFNKAMSYSNSNENTRVPNFNAQYAFSRIMLTLSIVSVGILMPKFYDLWWAWLIAVAVIILIGRRCKERGYYYAREVLIEYLKTKK